MTRTLKPLIFYVNSIKIALATSLLFFEICSHVFSSSQDYFCEEKENKRQKYV